MFFISIFVMYFLLICLSPHKFSTFWYQRHISLVGKIQLFVKLVLHYVGTPNPTWVGVECEKSQWSPSDLGM